MENTINFGELVLAGDALKGSQKPAAQKKASEPVFKCVASSGADFVIKRTTASTSRLLVMLVSQEQYYIKNERTGEIIPLSLKALNSFFQGFGESKIFVGCSWLEYFTNNKTQRETLAHIVTKRGFKQAATNGLITFDKFFGRYGYGCGNNPYELMEEIGSYTDTSAALIKYIGETASKLPTQRKQLLTSNIKPLVEVFKVYGLDRARNFIDRFVECSAFVNAEDTRRVDLEPLVDALSIVPTNEGIVAYSYRIEQQASGKPVSFQFDKLCDYLFNQSAREGFIDMREWLTDWKDSLLLQLYVSGKIVDKYPSNLLSVHQILSTEAARMKKVIDQTRWNKAEAAMREYDYAPEGSDYFVTHPATPDDMRAEAVAQSNCLSSYVDKVVNGRCMIFFARKASEPNKSLLTIEVSTSKMELIQVKARFNHEADDESMSFVARWCEAKGISLGIYEQRVTSLPAAA